jgi:hypothetical protein
VFHDFTLSLAVAYFTTNLALLRNDIQQGLLRLRRLHHGRLSHNSLRLGLASLPADSLDLELGLNGFKSKSKLNLCYDRWSVGQSWCQTPIWDQSQNILLSDGCRFVDVNALPEEKPGLSFTVAACPSQRTHLG